MTVSVNGDVQNFASEEFERLVRELPGLRFVFEHLLGMGLAVIGQFSTSTGKVRPKPSDDDYRKALRLAAYPNTYVKIGGIGELCPPPFPYSSIPPYIRMAYDAFGPRRIMWASDWPPVRQREGYRNALNYTRDQLTWCSEEDLGWIFGRTALSLWKFS
jgi:predicted TIM-barrel fold metal-dependent hydrolase